MVKSLLEEPAGFKTEIINVPNGFLRIGYALPPLRPRALVIVAPGLSDFMERYFGVIDDLLSQNLAVGILDWRGQGLSSRPAPAQTRLSHFATDSDDLRAAITQIQTKMTEKLPVFILAHSMGGGITLKTLAETPDLAIGAALSAPLCGLPVPLWSAAVLARLFNLFPAENILFGHLGSPLERFNKKAPFLTSCPVHIAATQHWLTTHPELGMGHLSFGWVQGAYDLTHALQTSGTVAAIKIPILFGFAGKEMIVNTAAQRLVAAQIPNSEILDLPEAKHEILFETAAIRSRFLEAFNGLVDRCLGKHAQ